MEEELQKLEDLFSMNFILTEEYEERKTEICAKYNVNPDSVASPSTSSVGINDYTSQNSYTEPPQLNDTYSIDNYSTPGYLSNDQNSNQNDALQNDSDLEEPELRASGSLAHPIVSSLTVKKSVTNNNNNSNQTFGGGLSWSQNQRFRSKELTVDEDEKYLLNNSLNRGVLNAARTETGFSSGIVEWTFEVSSFDSTGPFILCGMSRNNLNTNNFVGAQSNGWSYASNGQKVESAVLMNYGEPYGVNDIIGVKFDFNKGQLFFSKNGVDQGIAFSNVPKNINQVFPAASLPGKEKKTDTPSKIKIQDALNYVESGAAEEF